MINNTPTKKKWIAVGIVAALSTGFGCLMQFLAESTRDFMIESKNLGDILAQIEEANIDTRTLSSVLQEPLPLIFIFLVTVISVAITVWIYHKTLGYLCRKNEKPTQSNEPKKTDAPSRKQPDNKKPRFIFDESFNERIQRYTEKELESSLLTIDKEQHHKNYRSLCDELEKRKSQPVK